MYGYITAGSSNMDIDVFRGSGLESQVNLFVLKYPEMPNNKRKDSMEEHPTMKTQEKCYGYVPEHGRI